VLSGLKFALRSHPASVEDDKKDEDKERWASSLKAAESKREPSVAAHTFLYRWNSYSNPVALACDDGNDYVVKGRQVGRAIINDHIIAHLGFALGAPVGEPKIVEVPNELVISEPQMSHMSAGTAHGTLRIKDCSERESIQFTNESENRSRFALLAVLYGWTSAADHQLIYNNTSPRLVYSVDHGHFFPGGPEWKVSNLTSAPPAQLDATLVSACGLTPDELAKATQALKSLDEPSIIKAVASPPDEWGITNDERMALVEYLVDRRNKMLGM
jgi:hypothetical protein